MAASRAPQTSLGSTTVADLLERVLDKGVVIAGDIKVSLVDIELLSIQIRLVVCSVDKAREMGMDWWVNHPAFSRSAAPSQQAESLERLEQRLAAIESRLEAPPEPAALPAAPLGATPFAPAQVAPAPAPIPTPIPSPPEWTRPRPMA